MNNKQRQELRVFALATVENFEEFDPCSRVEAIKTLNNEADSYYEAAAEHILEYGNTPLDDLYSPCNEYLKNYNE